MAERSLAVLGVLCDATKLPLVSVGGISTADDVQKRLQAGAVLMQVYTALVYQGPGLLRRLSSDAV